MRARALAAVDLGVAALAQPGEADAGRVALERGREHLLVGLLEARVGEAEPAREQPEDLAVGARLADGGDRRLVEREVVVAPRPHDVEVLELRRGGEDDVGMRRGVGHELLAARP